MALLGDARDALDDGAGERAGEERVGERGRERTEAGELVCETEDVVLERVKAALVALREELGFIGGHVDLDGALGFAGLATEAEVERFVDGFTLKALFAQRAGEHLPEQAGAAAGGVLLQAGGAVTGTHDAAGGVAAGADTDAAVGGMGEGAVVFGEHEVCFERGLLRCGGDVAEVFDGVVDADSVNELAGIHVVVRVPEDLELAEGVHQFRPEHLWQERTARLSVAVFAAERAADGENDIGGAVEELAEVAQALWSVEVEVDAHVDAALTVVAVERTAVAVLGHQRGDAAEVFAEARGRNGGIFPAFPAVGLAGNEDDGAECGLADMPDGSRFGGRADVRGGRRGPGLRGADEGFGFGAGFFRGPCTHFDEKEADAERELLEIAQGEAFAAHELDEEMVEAFKADGAVLERERDGIGGEKAVGESKDGEDAMGRAGSEVERGGEDVDAGAFAADESAGDVEAAFRQELVEVVAGDATRDARKSFLDFGGVCVADARKALVDAADAAAGADEALEVGVAGAADGHAGSVVEDDVEGFDVIDDFAGHESVDAATVVADHAAEGAAGVRGGIGAVGELVELGGVAEAVENDAGLDAGELVCGVERFERVHPARIVEDDGDIGGLAGERGAGSARKDGGSGGAAGGDGGFDVGCVARVEDADGKLAVVGGVGGVERARAAIEENVAAEGGAEARLELAVGGEGLMIERLGVGEDGESAHGGMVARWACGCGRARSGWERSYEVSDSMSCVMPAKAKIRRIQDLGNMQGRCGKVQIHLRRGWVFIFVGAERGEAGRIGEAMRVEQRVGIV